MLIRLPEAPAARERWERRLTERGRRAARRTRLSVRWAAAADKSRLGSLEYAMVRITEPLGSVIQGERRPQACRRAGPIPRQRRDRGRAHGPWVARERLGPTARSSPPRSS